MTSYPALDPDQQTERVHPRETARRPDLSLAESARGSYAAGSTPEVSEKIAPRASCGGDGVGGEEDNVALQNNAFQTKRARRGVL